MRRARVFGRLLLTLTVQAEGAPLIDPCCGTTGEGRHYRGRAIVSPFGARNEQGERKAQTAIVIGWLEAKR